MNTYQIIPIGTIRQGEDGASIHLDKRYAEGLTGLEGFSHVQVLWWFSHCDTAEDRQVLAMEAPYRSAPGRLGTFATRSPQRPNPIALSAMQITYIDLEGAVLGIAYTDALDGTPVLDIKPYTPSIDRIETPSVPDWCSHWPASYEASADFDWESEIPDA